MATNATMTRGFLSGTINLRSTGTTEVFGAITGKKLFVTRAVLYVISSDATGLPAFALGNNSTDFNNLMTSKSVDVPGATAALSTSAVAIELALGTATNNQRWRVIDIGSTGISIKVNTAATGGATCNAVVYLEGYLV
jgi:hypothetical protein